MRYLVLDCNYLCHKSRFDTDQMAFDGQDTNVIFGFLDKVVNMCEAFDCNNLLFVWDSRESVRKKIFPDYKKKRGDKSDLSDEERESLNSAYEQMDILRTRILPAIGFKNIFRQEGYEGDDIMAEIVMEGELTDEFFMFASDKDLYMLLSQNVTMYSSKGDMFDRYSYKMFKEEWGIKPNQWHLVKAIAGCKSDEVPGCGKERMAPYNTVIGLAEKGACKYLLGTMKETTKAFKRIESTEGRRIKKRNLKLVSLPHPGTLPVDIVEDECRFGNFKKVVRQYGLKVFLESRKDEWQRVINGEYDE